MNSTIINKIKEKTQKNFTWVILLVLVVFFTLTSKNFLSARNIINILNANAYVLVAAIGVTFLMLSGAMDLSVGYIMSSCGVMCAILIENYHLPVIAAVTAGILLGIILSLINTFLAQMLRLSVLIVTLGTMTIYQGLSFLLSQSKVIKLTSDTYKFIGQGKVFATGNYDGFPFAIILAAVLFVLMNILLNKTYIGRYIYALGGNEEATHLAGINVKKVRYLIAIIAGTFIAIAALMLHARMGTSQSIYGPGTEFTVITAILLGGVSINGGKGKLSGVLGGVLIMAIFANGMQLGGIPQNFQYIAKGGILLIALGVDVLQTLSHQKSLIKKKTKMAEERLVQKNK